MGSVGTLQVSHSGCAFLSPCEACTSLPVLPASAPMGGKGGQWP